LTFGENGSEPEIAYLNYLVFDDNFTFVNTGFKELSVTTSYTKLALSNIHLAGSGYLIAYVSYESTNADRAYFDDFKVTHKLSPVIQVDDYYPFGLTFNSYNSGTKNNYLFNQGSEKTFQGEEGKSFAVERQPELEVDFTKYRTYDYALGRWWQVDPLADSLSWHSPYNGMDNNPIRYNDPYGDSPSIIWGAFIGAAVEIGTQVAINAATGKSLMDIDIADVGIAAGSGALTAGIGSIAKLGTAGARIANAVQSSEKAFSKAVVLKTSIVEGSKAAIDKKIGKEVAVVGAGKEWSEAGIDIAAGVISSPIGGSISKEASGAMQHAVSNLVETGLQGITQTPKEFVKEIIK